MTIRVNEKTIEEIKDRLDSINTPFNKIVYLESVLRESGFSFEIKRFLFEKLAELYEERKMYEKAAKMMAKKAGIEIRTQDKINSYIFSAELYSRLGKVDDAEGMFIRASRSATDEQRESINLARKNIYKLSAEKLESRGKKASAIKFYEKLIKMDLDEFEKKEIKKKLIDEYRALGFFKEARLLEGI